MKNFKKRTTNPQTLEMVKDTLPVEQIDNDKAREILTYLANFNLYSALNPDKTDRTQVSSMATMFVEGVMSVISRQPELAQEILKNMPATFQTSLSMVNGQEKTDIQIIPYANAFPVIVGCGEATMEMKDRLYDKLYDMRGGIDREEDKVQEQGRQMQKTVLHGELGL